ncbi:NUDIX hydrolase [Sporosarcina sp. 6E9]|uniref:NUDIX hydrolase n=1 Tax=Sporosarcina sp. 6E9 TaxID=2819235 RepID=UPI001FF0DA39|nr:NUDIX hydrolase [Sporosarcina sp. 6E9]
MIDAVFKTDVAVFNYRVAGIWILDQHVLLHKNVNDEHWALPGGRVKITEESKTGLRREFQEELNLNVKVKRLIWTTENFFNYDGKSFHEIAFYYQVTSNNDYELKSGEFYGTEEDKPLVYKWVPIAKLDEILLQPEFLKNGIKNIPIHPEHIIIK